MSKLTQLNADFAEQHPKQFAAALAELSLEDIAEMLQQLNTDAAVRVAASLPITQLSVLAGDGRLPANNLLASASLNDAIALLNRLPREQRLALVNQVRTKSKRRQLLQFLNYPPHSVGSIVSYAALRFAATEPLGNVITALNDSPTDVDTAVLVVDADGHYVGVVDPWQALLKKVTHASLADCMDTPTALRAEQSKLSARKIADWTHRTWLPVVDHQGRVVGLCWHTDLADDNLADAEATPEQSSIALRLATEFFQVMLRTLTLLLSREQSK